MHLGTYAVATKPNQPLDEMHVVYARPEDVRAYRRDGKFPDGATLVKEVTRVGSEKLTTGQSHWATDIKLWFVMIKDAKGRFPGNDLWGDGWGWALFLAKEPARNVATDYETDCKTCHVPARKDDWVYVRGYPVLVADAPRPIELRSGPASWRIAFPPVRWIFLVNRVELPRSLDRYGRRGHAPVTVNDRLEELFLPDE